MRWTPLLCVAVACSDFALVPVPQRTDTRMFVTIVADQRVGDAALRVSALLQPGVDAATRRAMRFDDPRLFVQDSAIAPVAVMTADAGEFLRYEWLRAIERTDDMPGSVLVRLPVADASSTTPFEISLPLVRRADPPSVDAGRDELALHATPIDLDLSGFLLEHSRWELRIGTTCADPQPSFLRLEGSGALPAELRIPLAWLEGIGTETTSVCLNVFVNYTIASAPYPTDVVTVSNVDWQVDLSSRGQ